MNEIAFVFFIFILNLFTYFVIFPYLFYYAKLITIHNKDVQYYAHLNNRYWNIFCN